MNINSPVDVRLIQGFQNDGTVAKVSLAGEVSRTLTNSDTIARVEDHFASESPLSIYLLILDGIACQVIGQDEYQWWKRFDGTTISPSKDDINFPHPDDKAREILKDLADLVKKYI